VWPCVFKLIFLDFLSAGVRGWRAGFSPHVTAEGAMIQTKQEILPRRRDPGCMPRLKHVALIVESAVAPRRMMLTGVARYIQEHDGEDYDTYAKPVPGAGGSGAESWEQQQRGLGAWLRGLHKPVGIMTTNDLMGQQLLEACRRARIKVPEGVAVVGADDDEPI